MATGNRGAGHLAPLGAGVEFDRFYVHPPDSPPRRRTPACGHEVGRGHGSRVARPVVDGLYVRAGLQVSDLAYRGKFLAGDQAVTRSTSAVADDSALPAGKFPCPWRGSRAADAPGWPGGATLPCPRPKLQEKAQGYLDAPRAMSTQSADVARPGPWNYGLTGPEGAAAIAAGLADAERDWPPIDADRLRRLMERTNGERPVIRRCGSFCRRGQRPGLRASAPGMPSPRSPPSVLSTAGRRMRVARERARHCVPGEGGDDVVYNVASFMLLRDRRRRSHLRHHSYSTIVEAMPRSAFPV